MGFLPCSLHQTQLASARLSSTPAPDAIVSLAGLLLPPMLLRVSVLVRRGQEERPSRQELLPMASIVRRGMLPPGAGLLWVSSVECRSWVACGVAVGIVESHPWFL